MKITKISMSNVKKGVNPFYTVEWSDATPEKVNQVNQILAQIGKSRISA